eukprot:9572458-Alexandrium_andersonii.AAC.1
MSASLVGSEMCIRDSACPWPRCSGRCRTAAGGTLCLVAPLGLRAEDPVSYTHLTLPTICSV